MKKIPDAVKKRIAVLDRYKEVDDIGAFHIIHLYKKDLAYPNGFYDAFNFEGVVFNYVTMEKQNIGIHDGIRFFECCPAKAISIFADGAMLVEFNDLVKIGLNTQCLFLTPCEKN